jgi:hypothetical protein
MNTHVRDHLNALRARETTTLTGTQNNFVVDGAFVFLVANNASALTLTGIALSGGNIDGARLFIDAINSNVIFKHQDTGSSAANRFITGSGSDITLQAGDRALLFYDDTVDRWRVGIVSLFGLSESIGAVNFFPDPYALIWPEGDTNPPAGATASYDGNSSIFRNSSNWLYGGMSAQLKLGTTATISTVLSWTIFSSLPTSWRGKTVGFGAWIYTTTTNLGRLQVSDGGTPGFTNSDLHDGSGNWRWITFTHQIASDATYLKVSLVASIAGQGASEVNASFDGITLTLGPLAPRDFKPTPSTERLIYYEKIAGNVTTGTDKFDYDERRPFIITRVDLRCKTAPTGSALIVDANQWTGSAWQSMFTTRPQIAAGSKEGGAAPDGTYRYRCFDGRKGTDSLAYALSNIDIDQVGSSTPGADLQIAIAVLQFQDPFAGLKL